LPFRGVEYGKPGGSRNAPQIEQNYRRPFFPFFSAGSRGDFVFRRPASLPEPDRHRRRAFLRIYQRARECKSLARATGILHLLLRDFAGARSDYFTARRSIANSSFSQLGRTFPAVGPRRGRVWRLFAGCIAQVSFFSSAALTRTIRVPLRRMAARSSFQPGQT